jgi:hypothetical protein
MAILNTRLTNTNQTRVFQSVGQQAITTMYFCNTTAGNVSINVYAVNSDDSTAGSLDNQIYANLEIQGYDTYVASTERLILDDNDEIEVEASSSNAITVTVSYVTV